MELSEEEEKVRSDAIRYARANKKVIARRITDKEKFLSEDVPVSVFMAGSPGAGKTEASKALIKKFDTPILRLDIDDLRDEFDGYTGNNSHLFQAAAAILLEKCHDLALSQKQSFVLDGTMADYDIAKKNIDRSIRKARFVQILFVYQQPSQAWNFVLAREKVEGRRVFQEKFINQYFSARENANQLKSELAGDISLDLLIKNIDGTTRAYHRNIQNIDGYIKETYSRADLVKITSSTQA